MVVRKWLRSEQWHFLLKVRQDAAPQQSVLAVSNTPENKSGRCQTKPIILAICVQKYSPKLQGMQRGL